MHTLYFEEKYISICNELDLTHQDATFAPFLGTALSDFEPVSVDLIRTLTTQNPNKSCIFGPPARWLNLCLDDLIPVITKIINTSLSSASVPDYFDSAIVKLLLKKRWSWCWVLKEISNLPFFSKLLESVCPCFSITLLQAACLTSSGNVQKESLHGNCCASCHKQSDYECWQKRCYCFLSLLNCQLLLIYCTMKFS